MLYKEDDLYKKLSKELNMVIRSNKDLTEAKRMEELKIALCAYIIKTSTEKNEEDYKKIDDIIIRFNSDIQKACKETLRENKITEFAGTAAVFLTFLAVGAGWLASPSLVLPIATIAVAIAISGFTYRVFKDSKIKEEVDKISTKLIPLIKENNINITYNNVDKENKSI